MVDARLPDGSRVNAIIPPLALDWSIHVDTAFRHRPSGRQPTGKAEEHFCGDDGGSVCRGACKDQHLDLRWYRCRKTTFLNILSQYIPKSERIVTIEDAAELRLALENIVRLETRPTQYRGDRAQYANVSF